LTATFLSSSLTCSARQSGLHHPARKFSKRLGEWPHGRPIGRNKGLNNTLKHPSEHIAVAELLVPTGEYEDFMTGFVVNDSSVWARPVGVAVAHDGALLVNEDGNGTIWRVSYHGGP
jgi:glucose/arabinose dehydrogenase